MTQAILNTKNRQDPYPSRLGAKSRLLKRADPIVYSEKRAKAPWQESQIASYRKNGFLTINRLFGASEVRILTEELKRLRKDRNQLHGEAVITEPDSNVVRSIFDVHKISRVLARLVRDSRLVSIARYLLGDEVYVHQSRLNYKPGFFGTDFYWHSDFETWHVEDGMPRMRALSVSISLTRNLGVNGPLMLVPGSHLNFVSCGGDTPADHYKQSLKKQGYGVPATTIMKQLIDANGIHAVTGRPGGATFFDCNTMHGSNSNISPYPRANAFIVYNSINNRLQAPYGTDKPRPEFLAERVNYSPLRIATGPVR